jgi:pimeloyl-ACP methyl ester carboxylesterase
MMRTSIRTIAVAAFALGPLGAHAATDGPVSSQSYDIRGAKIHVEIAGSGPPIVFLHGGLVFFDNNFAGQRDYFSSFRKVVGIDRRGHGHSPDDARPFSYAEMTEDTAALLEKLALGPVDIVGHSDGGNIGLLLAARHPELVRRLVVSGANLRAGLPPEELARRKAWTPEQHAERVKILAERVPPTFRTDYEKVSPDGSGHWMTIVEKSYRMWLTPTVIEGSELKSIGIPVLVIAGDHDFTSLEETIEIYRGLAKGELFIMPGTGHGTLSERPDLANLAIREFLEKPAK